MDDAWRARCGQCALRRVLLSGRQPQHWVGPALVSEPLVSLPSLSEVGHLLRGVWSGCLGVFSVEVASSAPLPSKHPSSRCNMLCLPRRLRACPLVMWTNSTFWFPSRGLFMLALSSALRTPMVSTVREKRQRLMRSQQRSCRFDKKGLCLA